MAQRSPSFTSPETAAMRVNLHYKSLEWWRRKVYILRRAVLGDYAFLESDSPDQIDTHAKAKRHDAQQFRDILVRNWKVGVTNKLAQCVRTLIHQTAFKLPEIGFEQAEANEEAILSLYLGQVLGPVPIGCNAVSAAQMRLADYIIGGVGFTHETIVDGRPVSEWADALHVVWDTGARYAGSEVFIGRFIERPYWMWEQLLDDPKGLREAAGFDPKEHAQGKDAPVELFAYYDILGESGSMMYLHVQEGGEVLPKTVGGATANPHFFQVAGARYPFNPITAQAYIELPSSRFSMSIIEPAVGVEIALRGGETMLSKVFRTPQFIEAEEGAYGDSELQKIKSGQTNEVVFRKANKPSMQRTQAPEVTAEMLQYVEKMKQEIIALVGVDPYASGDKVDDISYAAEVNAIKSQAGLLSATVSSDTALAWSLVARKTVANAFYDFMPRQISYEGVVLEFGPDNPIGPYLRQDVPAEVAEDSMGYESKDTKIARARAQFQDAMSAIAIAPASAAIAYETLLRAYGNKNIAEHFEPLQMQAPMLPQGAGQDQPAEPGAMAAASTQ